MLISVLGLQVDGWAALSLCIQFLLPLLVGFVTTKETNRNKQFLLLGALTLLATVATQVQQDHSDHVAINLVQIIVTAVVNFGISLLSHYQVWKPTNLSDLVLAVFSAKPSPVTPPETPTPAALSARHLAAVPTVLDPTPAASPAPSPVPDPLPVQALADPSVNRMAG